MSTIYGNAIIIPSAEGGTVVSVQDTKAVTITSNGTVSVTPDAPYDALKKVDVTVDVASEGGAGTTPVDVYCDSSSPNVPIFCTWQTENGWMGTSSFDITSDFTIPDVLVGGYIVFSKEPDNQLMFRVGNLYGVEEYDVYPPDGTGDVTNASVVVKVVDPYSISFSLMLIYA